MPNDIKKQIKELMFSFIWGKRDRVKRSTLSNATLDGGLNMVDLDAFFMSLKASWIRRVKFQGQMGRSI